MLENVGQVGFGRFERGQIQPFQGADVLGQFRFIGFDRVNGHQGAEVEDASNHAGDFERHLLGGCQTVNATGNDTLHRIGELQRIQVACFRRNRTLAVCHFDQPGIAQRIRQLLAEERIPLRAFADQGGDWLR